MHRHACNVHYTFLAIIVVVLDVILICSSPEVSFRAKLSATPSNASTKLHSEENDNSKNYYTSYNTCSIWHVVNSISSYTLYIIIFR